MTKKGDYISMATRVEICLHFLRNGSNVEATTAHCFTLLKDEPVFQKAQNKEKLVQNLFLEGGSGINREINIAAKREAIDLYTAEQQRQALSKLQKEIEDKDKKIADLERQRDSVERDYRRQVDTYQDLNTRFLNAGTRDSSEHSEVGDREEEEAVAD